MMLWKVVTISTICLVLVGCNNQSSVASKPMYFPSPISAVKQITVMLENKDWLELSRYYDLNNSSVDRATLISGEFFYTDEKPEAAHPAGFWHYKHPFSPAFKYASSHNLEEPGVIEVAVVVEIDQGGGMIQRGMQAFLMRKTNRGYQVMPSKTHVR